MPHSSTDPNTPNSSIETTWWPSWLRDFGKLAIANVLSNLMVPLSGLIDTAFLGHLAEIHYLAGVALATVVFNIIYWSFGFLRMGTTGLIAQTVGRSDDGEEWRIAMRAAAIALCLGLGILLLQTPIRQMGFALLEADSSVIASGEAFYQGRIWGAPAVLLNYVLLGWLLGLGKGRQVMLLAAIANGSNILLDYGLIVQLQWASYGAGLATALSQYIALIVGLLCLRSRLWPQSHWQQRLWQPAALVRVLRLNGDIMVRTWALLLSFSLFTHLSALISTEVLAVNTLLLQALMLVSYLLDGIAFATEAYAGKFHGQKQSQALRQLVWVGSGFSLVGGLGAAAIFITFPRSLFGLLSNHQSILVQLPQYVFWLLPVLGFGGLAFMLDGFFLGLSAGRLLRNASLVATLVGFMPGAIAAYWLRTPHLLWLSMSCFMALRAITLGYGLLHRGGLMSLGQPAKPPPL